MRLLLLTGILAWICADSVQAQFDAAAPLLIPYKLPLLQEGTVDFGDLDGDGDLDLVLTGLRDTEDPVSRVYVLDDSLYLQVVGGYPTPLSFKVYRPTPIVINNVWQGSTEWGDADGDGDEDLLIFGLTRVERIVGEFTTETVGNLYRSENGLLFNSGVQLPGLYSGDAAWADMDGDGDLDFAACGASELSSPFRPRTVLFRNNGRGGFTSVSHPVPGVMMCDLAWGDLNGDGLPDLAVAGESEEEGTITRVYLNTAGTLTRLPADLPKLSLATLDWADANQDGRDELVASGGLLDPELLRGHAVMMQWNGSAQISEVPGMQPVVAGGIAFTDFDVDGDPDIVYAGAETVLGGRSGWVVLNRDGQFRNEYTLAGLTLGDMSVGDYNGDGDDDIVVLGVNDEGRLFLNFFMNRIFPEPIPPGLIQR
ncbi:MAG: VCBS repeat-containing protein [Rhodothermales bacterium]|nr:VCBS repeat-containing protein [Rhodothermales bacterium]MBO6778903.1 VCBS repeat-containing protein [Rhodothermales bacterium]